MKKRNSNRTLLPLTILMFSLIDAFSQTGSFTYQFHSEEAKGGRFVFETPDKGFSFKADASAGYLVAANNPFFQDTKGFGPIPNGTWVIYEIKNEAKFILRLRPSDDVLIKYRDGFLIHGTGLDTSPEESSKGCIILERKFRKKLCDAFRQYGEIYIKVTNIVAADPTKRG